MPTGPTPRQQARADNIVRIKELALAQLAESGAAALSLRAVARELNLVSSAIYRYYASRDDLLTDLIVDAYADLAEVLEAAGAPDRRGARRRWIDTCLALRAWATAEPHRFTLIYGSTIPGYAAPEATIAPAGRVVRALCLPAAAGPSAGPSAARRGPGGELGGQLGAAAEALGLEVDRTRMLDLTAAFARLVGLLTLELNGQFTGGFEPADALYGVLVEREADVLGL
ncbi:TetR/AcrR family transcriptional regulator [Nocardioides donggukensis]|uniref:TetR/AcrR family transcriptional regulator n=1 Tax=Nocardioides donggukensis TaxID=2774019 RepID=A0A927K2I2_9ACTN|nr:TetR/AcrR family transcriptional regulator [Nocardioides donggukensis]MBD8868461.1 TetR/AcrR family transcriptional regulator [Nocardioides donggukensis]